MSRLDYGAFDADNHYYETEESFTRHLDPGLAKRSVAWCETDGVRRMLVAGRLLDFVPNDTFDPVSKPGALDEWFRGKNSAGKPMMEYYLDMEPLQRPYVDREARLALLDEQGVEATFMFPTIGAGIEDALEDDIEVLTATLSAFNRWLDEDWGLSHRGRIFAAPVLSLADADWALAELEWALERDARTIFIRPNPVKQPDGWRSLADPHYEAFWQRVNDAGICISFHQADTVYQSHSAYWIPQQGSSGLKFGENPMAAVMHLRAVSGAISDALCAFVCGGLFQRFPNLRVASIENGADWVDSCLWRLGMAAGQMPWAFPEDPAETFRRHVWIAPFQGEDFRHLAERIGAERILFGSDFPHPEGVAKPLSFLDDVSVFGAEDARKIMRENLRGLSERRPL
ncbi:MAG: amidohydrolase family protein [Planctomycetota bacterium]|jgi:predicted TIM-barrel fold metal-dependent hydrolase